MNNFNKLIHHVFLFDFGPIKRYLIYFMLKKNYEQVIRWNKILYVDFVILDLNMNIFFNVSKFKNKSVQKK